MISCRKLYILGIASLSMVIIYSCKQNLSQKEEKTFKKSKSKVIVNKQDSLIDFPCAVLIYPSNKTITRLKKEGPEEDFYIAADDNQYYMAQCIHFLDSVKTKKMVRESEGIASFKTLLAKLIK
jgi:hypothetical protein